MPITPLDLQQILDENRIVLVACATSLGTAQEILLLVHDNDYIAGQALPRNFHGVYVAVRYVDQLLPQPPRHPEEVVHPDHFDDTPKPKDPPVAISENQRLQILDENPHAINAFCSQRGKRSRIVVVIDADHAHAKETVPKTYFGLPVVVRCEKRPLCKPRWPLDPDLANDYD